jgi:hypothetical protein
MKTPHSLGFLGMCVYFAALQQKTLAPASDYPILESMLQCSKSKPADAQPSTDHSI